MTERFETIKTPERGRVIVIGDIHGCIDELRMLLGRLDVRARDLVIATGDLVRKGPRPDLCLRLFRDNGFRSVQGNNEQKLLTWSRHRWRRLILPAEDRRVVGRRDLLAYIGSWPVVIDLPSINAAVVHGGFFPRMNVSAEAVGTRSDDLVRLRYIRRDGDGWQRAGDKASDDSVLWCDRWNGPRTVLFGHTPLRRVLRRDHAIGLDTGCVYGGALTAAVYEHRRWRFERVPALRAYAR